jgi:regulatory protein YycI of two-component signal transduction system YycFG
MQWGQIKTIFIICFLILDIYLFTQIIGKERNPEELFNPQIATQEEELRERNITVENIPDAAKKIAYISAKWHTFTEEEIEKLEGQKVYNNGDKIVGELNEPIPIGVNPSKEVLSQLISDKILYSDQYTFYNWNETENVLIFFQHYKNQPLYFNKGGILILFLNDKMEITSYYQTMQGEITEETEEEEVSSPNEIIDVLLDNNLVLNGETIASMELGYHTFFPIDTGIQAFVPTWLVRIRDNEENMRMHFVNANDGELIDIEEENFIVDIVQDVAQIRTKIGSGES